jgi:hypothetical protein
VSSTGVRRRKSYRGTKLADRERLLDDSAVGKTAMRFLGGSGDENEGNGFVRADCLDGSHSRTRRKLDVGGDKIRLAEDRGGNGAFLTYRQAEGVIQAGAKCVFNGQSYYRLVLYDENVHAFSSR